LPFKVAGCWLLFGFEISTASSHDSVHQGQRWQLQELEESFAAQASQLRAALEQTRSELYRLKGRAAFGSV
jgi:hypothetical protein